MAEGKDTPPSEQEKEAQPSKPRTLRQFQGKPVWDWLQLLGVLAIPVVIAVGGCMFNAQQAARQQNLENQRAQQAQNLENQRARVERELAEQRTQDEVLQAYLGQMNTLLLEHKLRKSEVGSEVRTLARARTLTVLGRLDPSRKAAIMQFLVEAKLVQRVQESEPIIGLRGANLNHVDLIDANLSDADLEDANLRNASLPNANLNYAILDHADLSTLTPGNILDDTDLSDASLIHASLIHADLNGAFLSSADLRYAILDHADLSFASLNGAVLGDIGGGADLYLADLSYADLIDTVLSYVDLSGAYLSGAEVSEEQLDQANSLAGVIKPDDTVVSARYATREFEPALSLRLGDGWRLGWEYGWELGSPETPETPDVLNIGGPEEGIRLQFFSPVHVFDSSKPSERIEVPAPDNADAWVSWFQEHPNLDITSEPIPRSVGGESGEQIDVTPTPEPSSAVNCGRTAALPTRAMPCVYLFPIGGPVRIASYKRTKDRFIIVDNVEGETVVIRISAPADKFDEVLPKARKVLDTVEWKGG